VVTVSPAEGMLRFETTRSDEQLSQVLAGLVAGGVRVSQFRELQTDLEDAFMSVLQQHDGASAIATEKV
jgi:ABC-2 type transport system ATP-binding protein